MYLYSFLLLMIININYGQYIIVISSTFISLFIFNNDNKRVVKNYKYIFKKNFCYY